MKAALLLTVFALTGCAVERPPAQTSPALSSGLSVPADAASCQAASGEMKPVGRLQTLQCVLSYADAGKSCRSGDQCAGDCRAGPGVDAIPGQAVAGYCQATSDRFGCSTRVEGGRALATLCID